VAVGGVVCFLLLTPLVIEVDSIRSKYRVSYRGIATADLLFKDGRLFLHLWVLGWNRTIDPFVSKKKDVVVRQEALPKRKRRHLKIETVMKKGWAVLRSFRIKHFYVNIDTDDYRVNAWLYPLAILLTKERRTFRINFNGDTVIRFRIENRLGNMLLALV
jgi:hypothetical protein